MEVHRNRLSIYLNWSDSMKRRIINLTKRYLLLRIIVRKCLLVRNIILNTFNCFYKVDNKLVIFESYMGRSYSCSPKAIYEEMLNNPKYKDYKFIWVFKKIEDKKYLENDRTKLVKYKSKEYYKSYAKAKYWFANSRIPSEIRKKRNQIYTQCWHGTPLKKLGYDIIDESNNALNTKLEMSLKYKVEAKKFDYLISPSNFTTSKFITAFDLKNKDRIIELGYPRNDFLFKYNNEDIINIKKKFGLSINKKVILYAPTWRDNQHESGLGYTYKLEIDFDYLEKVLKDEYVILFRSHYFVSNSFDFDRYKDFVYDVSNVDDINDLYIISDILITDYSSVCFDFANLKKPIIFYTYDLDYYEKNLRGFYFNLDELPGSKVNSEKSIVEILSNIDKYKQEYELKYKLFNDKFNYLDSGCSSKKVVDEVIK